MKYGLELYSVRNDMENDFEGTLEKVKKMGYEGVEFAGLFGHTAKEVREMCERMGLEPIAAHVALEAMLEDPDKVFSEYKQIGTKYIAVPGLAEERRPGKPGFETTLADIALLAGKSREYGIQLLYHNHDFEFVKIDGKYGLDIIYDTIPSPLLKTELDTCWVNVAGEDPAKFLLKYSGRSPVVHIKDFVMKNRENKSGLYELIGIKTTEKTADEGDFAFRPIGYGVQDMPTLIDSAEKAGSEWLIVEQDRECLGLSSLECAEKSAEYIKKILNK